MTIFCKNKFQSFLNKVLQIVLFSLIFSCRNKDFQVILEKSFDNINIPPGTTFVFDPIIHIFEEGNLIKKIQGTEFIYYIENGDMQFKNLEYQAFDKKKIIVDCSARYSAYVDEINNVYFDDALIKNNENKIDVAAKELIVDFDANYVYGNKIKIFSENQEIDGDYLKYDLIEKNIKIISNITGLYHEEQ